MEKIALITDSICDLSKDIIKKYDIKVLPLKIIYKNREYIDGVDICAEDVYAKLKIEIPTTSMPSVGEVEDLYEKLVAEGYTHVIGTCISSGLSGTFNNLNLVAEDFSDKIKSYIIDSLSISKAEGELMVVAGEMIEQGKSFDEIIKVLPKCRDNIKCFFTFGTLEYLKKGGRIGKISGTIGELLNLKPIVSIDPKDGKYYTYDKVRGDKNAFNKLVSIATDLINEGPCKVKVLHGDALPKAERLYEILGKLPNVKSIDLGVLSAVAGVHSGPGFLAFGVIKDFEY